MGKVEKMFESRSEGRKPKTIVWRKKKKVVKGKGRILTVKTKGERENLKSQA